MSEDIHGGDDAQNSLSGEIIALKKTLSQRDEILSYCTDILTLRYDHGRMRAYIQFRDGDAITDPISLPSRKAALRIAGKYYQLTTKDAKPQAVKEVMEALCARAIGEKSEEARQITTAAPAAENADDALLDQYHTPLTTKPEVREKSAKDVSASLLDEDETDKPKKKSQAKVLIGLIDECKIELFQNDDEAYARVPLDNGAKALYRVRSRDMSRFLSKQYFVKTDGDAVRSQSMSDALNGIEARALHGSPAIQVSLRIAYGKDEICIDLGDDVWREVCITCNGWVIRPHTRYFRRAKGMLALPEPKICDDLTLLRRHINMAGNKNDGIWALVASWLVAAIATAGPYATLAFIAEQGAAKSTIARMLRSLIDPSVVPLVSTPHEDRDLLIAANASHVIGIDNLSRIDSDLSDLLCCIASGAGYRARTLFSDADETIISVRRPIILTAITDVVRRSDLANRTVTVRPPTIAENERQDEENLWAEFERDRPLIFGALLDAASLVLRKRDEVQRTITYKPRMLDYAIAAVAAETAYGVDLGTWQRAHKEMQGEAHAAAMESTFAVAVTEMLDKNDGAWSGDATSLLDTLTAPFLLPSAKIPQGWPVDATRLSGELRRLIPDARACGIEILIDQKKKDPSSRRQIIEINRSKPGNQPSQPSGSSDEHESPKAEPSDSKADGSLFEHAKATKPDSSALNETHRVEADADREVFA